MSGAPVTFYVQALAVALFVFLGVTIPFAATSWAVWSSQPHLRNRFAANLHWIWLFCALVLLGLVVYYG